MKYDYTMNSLLILTISVIHFSSKGWENELFELGGERVYPFTPKFKKYILDQNSLKLFLFRNVSRMDAGSKAWNKRYTLMFSIYPIERSPSIVSKQLALWPCAYRNGILVRLLTLYTPELKKCILPAFQKAIV